MKSKIKFSSLLLSILFFATACTTYQGPMPDFSKKGADAQAEYDKFELSESYWDSGTAIWVMGKDHTTFSAGSIEPVIESVSPKAAEKLEQTRPFEIASYVLIGALTVAGVQWVHYNDKLSQDLYYLLLGTFIANGIFINIQRTHVAEQYNQDLKAKFSPQIGWNFKF
jgi:hypothetical protein